ncbi:hypothetical protein Ancab_018887 [Ancistrocladus abbreviatus]
MGSLNQDDDLHTAQQPWSLCDALPSASKDRRVGVSCPGRCMLGHNKLTASWRGSDRWRMMSFQGPKNLSNIGSLQRVENTWASIARGSRNPSRRSGQNKILNESSKHDTGKHLGQLNYKGCMTLYEAVYHDPGLVPWSVCDVFWMIENAV